MKRFSIFLILFFVISGPASAEETGQPVQLETPDHITLQAVYYPARDAKASVLLLHMLGKDKSDWKDFAAALRANGYEALAVDLRGHGESAKQKDQIFSWKKFEPSDFKMMTEDVSTAYQWLKQKNGSKPVFIVGASLGANLAIVLASQNPEIAGAALLSPGLDYRGIQIARYTAQYVGRPLFMTAARDDEYSWVSAHYLMDLAKTDDKTLKDYPPGAGHGTQIFKFKPAEKNETALQDLLLEWLGKHLSRVSPVS